METKQITTTVIEAADGKVLRRRSDGVVCGKTVHLGYNYYEGGMPSRPSADTPPMEIFSGKYYTEGGVLYLCTRDSGQALSHDLSALVGLYVEVVPGGTGGGGDE